MTYKPNKIKNLSRLLPLLLLSVLFYGVMGFLTLKASNIHYARLPQVTTGQLGNEEFTSIQLRYSDIESARILLSKPTEPCETGQFFTKTNVKSVFTYYYAKEAWDNLYIKRTRSILAIPKELYETRQVFKIEIKTKEDFTYYYAKQVWATLDREKNNENYYAINGGIMRSDHIILDGYEELHDGMEVFPQNLHKKE